MREQNRRRHRETTSKKKSQLVNGGSNYLTSTSTFLHRGNRILAYSEIDGVDAQKSMYKHTHNPHPPPLTPPAYRFRQCASEWLDMVLCAWKQELLRISTFGPFFAPTQELWAES